MTTPAIPPRQPGETRYAYANRRSRALTGQTLYQRRIARAQAAGLNRQQARGHGAPVAGSPILGAIGETEYQRRNRLSVERTGLTLYQRRIMAIDAWLIAEGYTPATTGMSWTSLRGIQPRLKWINNNTSPNGGITPGMIEEMTDYERLGMIPRGWVADRINKRFEAMYEFKQGNPATGRFWWFNDGAYGLPQSQAQWWYYH